MRIKTHPLMAFTYFKSYSPVLILPLIRLIFEIAAKRNLKIFLPIETAGFSAVVAIMLVKWRFLRVFGTKSGISVSSGVLFKTQTKIPFERISCLYLRRNAVERILGAYTVFISTQAANKGFDIKLILTKRGVNLLFSELSDREIKSAEYWRAFKVALWAATAGGAFSGSLVSVPIINRAAELLGLSIYGIITERIAADYGIWGKTMPLVANALTAALLLFYLLGFLYQVLKNWNLATGFSEGGVENASGIITKHRTSFKGSAIRGIVAEQSLLLKIFGLFTIKAAIGRFEGKKGKGNTLIAPIAGNLRTKNTLLSFYPEACGGQTAKIKIGRHRAILPAVWLFFGSAGLTAALLYRFSGAAQLIVLLFFFACIGFLWWGDLLLYSYKQGKLCLGDTVTAVGISGFKRRTICCRADDIGMITVKENPFYRRRGICKVKIVLFTKCAESVKVKWLCRDELLGKILK